ncbi:MAG: hypothetical protein M1822_006942 [Bathelium mastoideum]|nr:MAG: hypothetical protein M1822_006942 [Bathelium mastoideum]
MAEIIGLISSIAQLADSSHKIVLFIDSLKNASKDQKELFGELKIFLPILYSLLDKTHDQRRQNLDQEWLDAMRQLKPALDELVLSLGRMTDQLPVQPGSKLKTFTGNVGWVLTQEKFKKVLSRIERIKSTILVALNRSTSDLLLVIKKEMACIQEETALIKHVATKLEITARALEELGSERDLNTRQETLAWLSHLSFVDTQHEKIKARHAGTGVWLLESPEYLSWIDNQGKTIWCPGIPGAGKSVMASIVVDDLRHRFDTDNNVAVGCAFFDYAKLDKQRNTDVLCDIYRQFLYDLESLPQELIEMKTDCKNQHHKPCGVPEITRLLQVELARRSAVYVVIDAFDECRDDRARELLHILRSLGDHVNLLITSRDIESIANQLGTHDKLEIKASRSDVEAYIRHVVQGGRRLSTEAKKEPTFTEEIVRIVADKAQQMFLLVTLHMESLAAQLTMRGIKKVLRSLPDSLDQTYDSAMARIQGRDGEVAKLALQVLCWVSYTFRPLTLRELQHALAIEPGITKFNEDNVISDDDDIFSCCAGLVVIDGSNNTVRLVHYTAKDYFIKNRQKWFPEAEKTLSKACITYLLYDRTFSESNITQDQLFEDFPFIGYAARFWGEHARDRAEQDRELQSLAMELLQNGRKSDIFLTKPRREDVLDNYSGNWAIGKAPRGIHIAGCFGLNDTVKKLLNSCAEIEQPDLQGLTALHWACGSGHIGTVELLVDHGADVNTGGMRGAVTPMKCAVECGYLDIVRLLIKHGASVNDEEILDARLSSTTTSEPALHQACTHGWLEVVECLLQAGANINQKAGPGRRSPLDCAVAANQAETVERLIEHEVDLTTKKGFRALMMTIERDQRGCFGILIHHCATMLTPEEHELLFDFALDFGMYPYLETLAIYNPECDPSRSVKQVVDAAASKQSWYGWVTEAEPLLDAQTRGQSKPFQQWKRKGLRVYSEQSTDHTYCGIIVPAGCAQVDHLVFRMDSHDQGWSDWPHGHGTYSGTHTWFDTYVQFCSQEDKQPYCRRIQDNVHADLEFRKHTIVWSRDDPDADIAKCIREIMPGDWIQIRANAAFPGWRNFVRGVEIELYAHTRGT